MNIQDALKASVHGTTREWAKMTDESNEAAFCKTNGIEARRVALMIGEATRITTIALECAEECGEVISHKFGGTRLWWPKGYLAELAGQVADEKLAQWAQGVLKFNLEFSRKEVVHAH